MLKHTNNEHKRSSSTQSSTTKTQSKRSRRAGVTTDAEAMAKLQEHMQTSDNKHIYQQYMPPQIDES
ncbi:hypothetical protein JCM10207_001370 [Rhodosporidiobolus poonsookiae]